MSLHKMLEKVKESLRPDDSLMKVRDDVLSIINNEIKKRDVKAEAVPGGSVAKNTYLAGDHDIDIFVRFSLDYLEQEDFLSDILEKIIAVFKPIRIHGSRDYFQFTKNNVIFEVIPVLAVDSHEQARNVTDMSPLHVTYFLGRVNDKHDEVRLAKQFMKSAGVYGAETYIRGFSGHVVDMLILHYGSFYELVKEASKWKAHVIIDIEDHHSEPLSAIDTAKHAPLVLVDPVQPERNAAAALSKEAFEKFVNRCKEFIKSPDERFFVVEEFDELSLRKRLSDHPGFSTIIYMKHPDGDKKDIAGARIKKAFERLRAAYSRAGFTLAEDGWSFHFNEESLLWFVTEEHSLPRMVEHEGPPVSAEHDAARFRDAHPDFFEKDGRLFARVERNVRFPNKVPELLADILSKNVRVNFRVEVLQ